jgi:peptidylprolyl isomerase
MSIFTLSACAKLTAAQIVGKASKVMQATKNYNITQTTKITQEGGPSDSTDVDVSAVGSGTIDMANNAFAMNSDITSADTASTSVTQSLKMYILDNTVYRNFSIAGAQSDWTNNTSTPDDWKEISFADIKKIQDILVGAPAKLRNDETIGSIPCYVLDITADAKKLYGLTSQPGMVNQDVGSIQYWDNISKDFSSKIWIAKDTFNLTKMDIKLTFGIKPQDVNLPQGSADIKLTMQTSVLFNSFNKANPIIVPAEAKVPAASTASTAPAMTIDKNKTYTATIKTNFGDIVIQLLPKDAPLTVNNFVVLARQGFYDGIIFHRVVKGFMIQSGDPTGTGSGGPGYKFADELPTTLDYTKGTVAMANSGPNTNGSQFFIMLGDYSGGKLPKNYSIFGKVTGGQDIVDKIGEVPVTKSASGEVSSPTVDVHIVTVTITEK